MTDLSPQAQAVLDAANGKSSWGADDILNDSRWIAAAALRAAADIVDDREATRQLNAIAYELEAQWLKPSTTNSTPFLGSINKIPYYYTQSTEQSR